MTEISVVAQEIAASRQRSIPADEGKLWETVRLDAERAGAVEEILRGFLDLVVLRHGLVARIGHLAARGGGYRRVSPFLTPDRHRAIQNEPRSPPSHPEAAAQGDELGRL